MPRILVCSDSHGRADLLALAYDQQPKAEALVFLGDGLSDTGIFSSSGKTHYLVRGNCDAGAQIPATQGFLFGGKNIMCTHGHRYYVKHSLDELLRHAKQHAFDLVLYGHTHVPRVDYIDGIYFFNPGSLWQDKSYGFVDVSPAGIVCQNLRARVY